MSDDVRIEAKLDKLLEHVIELKEAAAAQQATLDDRSRRISDIEHSIVPLQTHVAQIRGAAKLAGGLAILAGAVTGILKVVWAR